jgi:hypothetical protein
MAAQRYRDFEKIAIFGLCQMCDVLKKTTFRKLDLSTSSGKMMGAPTLLAPLEGVNLNHRITLVKIMGILGFVCCIYFRLSFHPLC